MRKRFRVLLLAAIVAAVVVPVGFALSPDPPVLMHTRATVVVASAAPTAVVAPTFVRSADAAPGVEPFGAIYDAGKLLLIGTVLFGLAAAVRKAV